MNFIFVTLSLLVGLCYISYGNAAAIDIYPDETGVVLVTEDLFRSLHFGNARAIEVENIDEHVYRGLKPVDDFTAPESPDCFEQFEKYKAEHLASLQKLANERCKDFIACWYCPSGKLFITFIVKPTFPPCRPILPNFTAKIPVCELPGPELDLVA